MEIDRATVITIFAVITLAASWVIGIYFTRLQTSFASYYIAERGLPTFVILMATVSTTISGWTFVGGPGIGYSFGFSYMLPTAIYLVVPMALVSWFLNARKFRVMAETHGVMTVGDVGYARYGNSRTVGALTGLACFVGYVGYMSAQIKSLGWLMNVIFGWPMEVGTIVGILIVGSYTIAGGVHAAVYADIFQGVLMALASAFITVAAIWVVGGPGVAYEGMKQVDPMLAHPQGKWSTLFIMSYVLAIGVGIMNWPHITQRYMMIRKLSGFKWLPLMVGYGGMVTAFLVFSIPYAYYGFMAQGDPGAPKLAAGDMVTPQFLMSYMPGAVSGIILAGVLSAILSTASGFITAGSAAIMRDMVQRGLGVTIRREVLWARVAGVALLVLAWFLGLTAPEFVVLLGVAASGIWGASIVVAVTIGVSWRGASREGAIACLLWGIFATTILQLGNIYGWWKLPAGMQAGAMTFPISVLLFYVISKLTNPKRQVPADMEMVMRVPLFTRAPALPITRPTPAGGSTELTTGGAEGEDSTSKEERGEGGQPEGEVS